MGHGLTDPRTDGRTDKASYRDAWTHLKSCSEYSALPTRFSPQSPAYFASVFPTAEFIFVKENGELFEKVASRSSCHSLSTFATYLYFLIGVLVDISLRLRDWT